MEFGTDELPLMIETSSYICQNYIFTIDIL